MVGWLRDAVTTSDGKLTCQSVRVASSECRDGVTVCAVLTAY